MRPRFTEYFRPLAYSMSQSSRGATKMKLTVVAIAVGSALLGACGASDLVATSAEVVRIERTCEFQKSRRSSYGETSNDKCNATGEFARIQAEGKNRRTRVTGTARMDVSYTVPGTSETRIGTLEFDGYDDEFYVDRGDKIDILVSKTDPAKIGV